MPYYILLLITQKHQAKITRSIHTQYACLLLSTLMWLEFFKIYWESPCLGEALKSTTMLVLSKMAPESYASLSIWQPSGTSRELEARQARILNIAYHTQLPKINK